MATKNNYFSHDSNARNDEKIIKLRIALGFEGYGIYFALLERLREEKDYKSNKNYSVLSYDLRVEEEKIRRVVEDFDLFIVEDDVFYSKSFLERMEIKDSKRKARSEAGKKGAEERWKNKDTEKDSNSNAGIAKECDSNSNVDIAKECDSNSNAIKTDSEKMAKNSKGKERKGNMYIYSPTSVEMELSDLFFSKLLTLNPKMKEPNMNNWANEFNKTIRIDKRTPEELKAMINWIVSHKFWSTNILSPTKLRKHFDKVYIQMRQENVNAFNNIQESVVNEYGWTDM